MADKKKPGSTGPKRRRGRPGGPERMVGVGVSFPASVLEEIDSLVESAKPAYRDRSEFVRDLVTRAIRKDATEVVTQRVRSQMEVLAGLIRADTPSVVLISQSQVVRVSPDYFRAQSLVFAKLASLWVTYPEMIELALRTAYAGSPALKPSLSLFASLTSLKAIEVHLETRSHPSAQMLVPHLRDGYPAIKTFTLDIVEKVTEIWSQYHQTLQLLEIFDLTERKFGDATDALQRWTSLTSSEIIARTLRSLN